jgi:hypothetical protein
MKKAITGIMLAIMAMSAFSFLPNATSADTQVQGKWVRMDDNIMNWTFTNDTTVNASGWVVANAAIVNKTGTIQEWAVVHGIWSELVISPMDSAYPLGSGHDFDDSVIPVGVNTSYTFSFYNAKLLNLTDLSFNKTETGHDFYLAGLWNVSDITETINVTWSPSKDDFWHRPQITVTWTETPYVTNATGTLVADWGKFVTPGGGEWPGSTMFGTFVLSIDGIGKLMGYAARQFQWLTPLNICDLDDITGTPRGTVDINDLVKVAQHYGEAPGFSDYDPSLDVRGDGIIDIGDLTTIAANIQG